MSQVHFQYEDADPSTPGSGAILQMRSDKTVRVKHDDGSSVILGGVFSLIVQQDVSPVHG